MQKLLSRIKGKELRSFMLFFLTAAFGASVNFFSQIPYKSLLLSFGLNHDAAFQWSVFLGYMTATVVSFVPEKLFAFSAQGTGNTKRESIKFLIIAVVALGVQMGVTYLTKKYVADVFFSSYSLIIREKLSHLSGMGCSFLANYFGHKFLTFRSTGIYERFSTKNAQ